MNNGLFGIINIGASAFRMVIVEFNQKGMRELEYLIKPLRLGVDTFSQGYISLEHVKQAAEILSNFNIKLKEYGVTQYRALCTSGVREAGNKDFFIDYIKVHTGIDLEVLEPSEEVYIKYASAKSAVADFDIMEKHGVVFANIASGNVTLSITKGVRVLYSGTLPYGSLRLKQMFVHVPFLKRYKAFDQYVDNMIKTVTATINPAERVSYLVGGGSSINLMLRLFKPKSNYILRKELIDLYKNVRTYSRQELIEELKLREDEAAVLIPTLSTYIHLLEFTKSDKFFFSRSNFPITLAEFYQGRLKDSGFKNRVKNTLIGFAEKYKSHIDHVKKTEKFALKLFTELKEIHSLTDDDYKILETAALLHEVGYFIDNTDVAQNSYFVIKSLAIPGWKQETMRLAACVVYRMNMKVADKDISAVASLTVTERLLINKLACILKTASSLDAGKHNLIRDFSVNIMDNVIIIDAFTDREPFVELSAFENQKRMFVETFGIPIDIRVRITYD